LLIASAGACGGSSQGEQVRDARMERAEQRADTQENTVERERDARDVAIDKRYDQYQKEMAAGERSSSSSSKELVELSKDRAQYQSEARERVDKLGVRIDQAKQKIDIMGTTAPSTLRGELQTAQKQHELAQQEVAQLNRTSADQWDRATEQLEQDESELDDRVSKLEDHVEDHE
jgi:DUF4097 and DUF4098 domain-containing protein YvlB